MKDLSDYLMQRPESKKASILVQIDRQLHLEVKQKLKQSGFTVKELVVASFKKYLDEVKEQTS